MPNWLTENLKYGRIILHAVEVIFLHPAHAGQLNLTYVFSSRQPSSSSVDATEAFNFLRVMKRERPPKTVDARQFDCIYL